MTEETTQPPVEQEAPQAVQEQPVENSTEDKPQDTQPEKLQQEPPKEDVNWKKARDIMKAQAMQLTELKKELEGMKSPVRDEFEGIDKDDYITFEQAQRLAEKNAGKTAHDIASKIVEEKMHLVEGERLEEKARDKYSDYDYVIDNFAIPMIEKNPALAQAIKLSKNCAETAYRFAKASPEYEAVIAKRNKSGSQQEVDKVMKNQERPMPSSTAGASLQSQVEQFASMSPEDVWKKAKEYSRKAR